MQFTLLNQENQACWEATYIEAFPEEERLPFGQQTIRLNRVSVIEDTLS